MGNRIIINTHLQPVGLVQQILLPHNFVNFVTQSLTLFSVFHPYRHLKGAAVRHFGISGIAIPFHRAVGHIQVGIRTVCQITGPTDHSANLIGFVIQQELTTYDSPLFAKQTTGQFVGNHSLADAALQIGLRKRLPLEKAERIDTEISRIGFDNLYREITATVGRLNVLHCSESGSTHRTGILQRIEPFLQCPVRVSVAPRLKTAILVPLERGPRQVIRIPAVHLRIHRRQLHIVNHRHNHRHGDSQPRTGNVERTEQAVLPEQGKGLSEIGL